jgi:CheY-like chemotaxis protein
MKNAYILLVEDDPNDVTLIKAALETAEVDNPLHVLTSAEEAIAYLAGEGEYQNRELHPVPRVIFLDLNLPGKSGHDVLEWMGKQHALKEVVRIVLTGSADPADLRKAYQLGANSYLRKPLTPQQLTEPGRNLKMFLLMSNRASSMAGASQ